MVTAVADSDAVLEANRNFYRAFSDVDLEAMADIWAVEAPVACVHPGWPALHGRAQVLDSWERIMEGSPPQIACTAERIYLYGETAMVICTEVLGDGYLIATNLFCRENGRWKLAHHQAGPAPAPPSDFDDEPPDTIH